jgi:hypothetical protein
MFLAAIPEVRRRQNWRAALILIAVLSLSVSVATRYTVPNSDAVGVKIVKPPSPDAKRQHLVRDAQNWTAPAPKFAFIPLVRTNVHVISAIFPATNLSSESWLYNRPPPSS